MRFKCLVLSSLILLAYFAANANAVQDAGTVTVGQGESLADKLMEDSANPTTYSNPAGFPATPKISRDLQANKTSMDWEMPNTLSGGANSAKASRDSSIATSDAAQDTTAAEPAAAETAPVQSELPAAIAAPAAAASGSWSLQLNDNSEKDIILSIFQNGDALFGAGNMKEGNNTLQVAASGSLVGDKMDLDITTLGSISLYRLSLTLSGDSASGDYSAFSASGDAWTGSANGLRS